MKTDFAALTRQDTQIEIPGWGTLTIPWVNAFGWLRALGSPGMAVFCLAPPVEQSRLLRALAQGQLRVEDVETASYEMIKAHTGRVWYEAVKLANTGAHPEFLGELTLAGVDELRVTIGQWVAAVYRLATQHADQKERLKFDYQLSLPPAGHEPAWDDGWVEPENPSRR